MYALFGLENVADPADADGAAFGYPQLSDEYLVDADPDIIFLADTICAARALRPLPSARLGPALGCPERHRYRARRRHRLALGPRLVDFIESIALAIDSAAVPA